MLFCNATKNASWSDLNLMLQNKLIENLDYLLHLGDGEIEKYVNWFIYDYISQRVL